MKSKLFPVDPRGLDDVANSLLNGTPTTETATSPTTPLRGATNLSNAANYLILQGKNHGTYSYPDLLVPIDRSYQNQNWNQSGDSLQREGSIRLTIRQYADFLKMLKSGTVYDGNGRRVDNQRVNGILDDILTVRNPYRAEWLDAKFDKKGVVRASWSITYHKIKPDGSLEKVTEPIEECLRDDKTPGIDLDHWLNNATKQGLPPKNNPNGSLYYWHPRDGAVARFDANSVRVGLNCGRDHQDSNTGLGVRAAKIKR